MRDSAVPRTSSEIYAEPADAEVTRERLRRATLLHRTGSALSSERNRDRLLETILVEAQGVCHADGGTLYLRNDRFVRSGVISMTQNSGPGSAAAGAGIRKRRASVAATRI